MKKAPHENYLVILFLLMFWYEVADYKVNRNIWQTDSVSILMMNMVAWNCKKKRNPTKWKTFLACDNVLNQFSSIVIIGLNEDEINHIIS